MIKYRADVINSKTKVEGFYYVNHKTGSHLIRFDKTQNNEDLWIYEALEIKPETLEIFLFGSWHLVSELETKYKLVEV